MAKISIAWGVIAGSSTGASILRASGLSSVSRIDLGRYLVTFDDPVDEGSWGGLIESLVPASGEEPPLHAALEMVPQLASTQLEIRLRRIDGNPRDGIFHLQIFS